MIVLSIGNHWGERCTLGGCEGANDREGGDGGGGEGDGSSGGETVSVAAVVVNVVGSAMDRWVELDAEQMECDPRIHTEFCIGFKRSGPGQ